MRNMESERAKMGTGETGVVGPTVEELEGKFGAGIIPRHEDFVDLISVADVGREAVGLARGQTGPIGPGPGLELNSGRLRLKLKAGHGLTCDADGVVVLVHPYGPTGAGGATGLQGATGAAGGVGATGPLGPRGKEGNTGSRGLDGVTGLRGVQGEDGATGEGGITGPVGATGIRGATGPHGFAESGTFRMGLLGQTAVDGFRRVFPSDFPHCTFAVDTAYSVGVVLRNDGCLYFYINAPATSDIDRFMCFMLSEG